MRICFLILLSTVTIVAPAEAVIPQLFGPFQALLAVMPQILLFMVAGTAALLKFRTWRAAFVKAGHAARNHPLITTACTLLLVGGLAAFLLIPRTNQQPQTQAIPAGHNWSMFRGGIARTGHLDAIPGPQSATQLWSFDADSSVADFSSSPAVVGNRLFIGCAEASVFSSHGCIYALDTGTGDEVWRYETPRPIFSSPSVADAKVYIGEGLHTDNDAHLYCLDAASGTLVWSFPTSSHVESSPCIVGGVAYFGAGADGVYAVNANTGNKLWQYTGVHVDASPIVWRGALYVGTGYGEPAIYRLDATTGDQVWKTPVQYSAWGTPAIEGDAIFIGLGNGNYVEAAEDPHGQVICLDTGTGDIRWTRDTNATVIASVAVSDGTVYGGDRNGTLYALRADDGEILWSVELDEPILSAPAVDQTQCYVILQSGRLQVLDRSSGDRLWEHALGGGRVLSSPAIAQGNLYVGLNSASVVAVGENSLH